MTVKESKVIDVEVVGNGYIVLTSDNVQYVAEDIKRLKIIIKAILAPKGLTKKVYDGLKDS